MPLTLQAIGDTILASHHNQIYNLLKGVAGHEEQITIGVGSAAAPPYSFFGDTDTGWYRQAADTIDIVAGGKAVARFFGASSAVNFLHLLASNAGTAVQLRSAGGDTNVGLDISSKGTGSVSIWSGDVSRRLAEFVNTASS